MLTKRIALALTIVSLLGLSGCGGDDEADREAVISWLLTQGETQAGAECFADELKGYDVSEFEKFDQGDVDEDFAAKVEAASEICADK